MTAYEVFDRKRPPQAHARATPTVTLGSNGKLLMFNAAAARLLKGVSHAVLMFDKDTRRIAIAPADASSAIAYKVSHMPSAANMACAAFAKHYGLAPGVPWELVSEDAMFCASVGEIASGAAADSQ